MKILTLVLSILCFSTITLADSEEIKCFFEEKTSTWSMELIPGILLAGIKFDKESIQSAHNAGMPVISQWYKKMITMKSIQNGSIYFIERTKESDKIVNLMVGEIIDGSLENIKSAVWLLELGITSQTLGNVTCEVSL